MIKGKGIFVIPDPLPTGKSAGPAGWGIGHRCKSSAVGKQPALRHGRRLSVSFRYPQGPAPKSIKVRWQTADFQDRRKTFTGWTAQMMQQEPDHSEGSLI